MLTLGFRKGDVAIALEFAAGLPHSMTAPERVEPILRRRGARGPVRIAAPEVSP